MSAKKTTAGRKFPPEPLTRSEVQSLLKAFSRAPTAIRNAAMVVVGYRAGLRVSEVLALHVRDVKLDKGEIHVKNGKGGKARRVGIDPEAAAVVERWLNVRSKLAGVTKESVLFCTLRGGKVSPDYVRAMLPRIAKRAGLERRVNFHALRHGCAYELLTEGISVVAIQKCLGHSSLSTTAKYLDHLQADDLVEIAQNRPSWKG